jgi:hypothetical protein
VQLGTLVEFHWKYYDDAQAEKISVPGFKWIILSEADKASVREKIVTKMFECENKVVYKQYVRSMTTICRFDYPEKWPNLLTGDITNALNSGNEKGIVTGLQALWCLTKKYEFEIEEDREPLFPIMQHALGIIGGIIDTYMNQTENEIALKIMHLVGKVFYNSNQLYLCPFLQEGD